MDSRSQESGFHAMDGVDFSDSDLVIHVRDVLTSVSKVSVLFVLSWKIGISFPFFNFNNNSFDDIHIGESVLELVLKLC